MWIKQAGSEEKRYLAKLALARGFAPVSLASRVGMDQRDLGRWFKRSGNGNGQILADVAAALKTSTLQVRVRVSPKNLTAADLARAERDLLSDVRYNVEAYPDPESFAKAVRVRLATCRPETRRAVLTKYARDRELQADGLAQSIAALYADLRSDASSTDFASTKSRRDALPQPTPYHAAEEAAIASLERSAGLIVPLKVPRTTSELAKSLFAYSRSLAVFKDRRTGERVFSNERVSELVGDLLCALGKAGWPAAIRDAAHAQYNSYFGRKL